MACQVSMIFHMDQVFYLNVDELLFFKNSHHDNIIEPFEFGKTVLLITFINEIGWQA